MKKEQLTNKTLLFFSWCRRAAGRTVFRAVGEHACEFILIEKISFLQDSSLLL